MGNDTDPNAGSGFAWVYTPDEQNPGCCKIADWNKTNPSTGRAYVPAVAPADAGVCAGMPVTRIAKTGGSKALSISGVLDFTYATNLKRIENFQFQQCDNITGVVSLPPSLEYLGVSAFLGCIHLGSVTFAPDSRLQTISDRAFDDCAISGTLEIPKSVTNIGPYAFRHSSTYGGNNRIDKLVIPQGSRLQQIGQGAFYQNDISNDLVFPDSTSLIASKAFSQNKITGVFLSKTTGSMQVGDHAFDNNAITNNPISGVKFYQLGESAFAHNDITSRPIDAAGSYDHTVDFSACSLYMTSPSGHLIEGNPSVEKVVVSQYWGYIPDYFLAGNKKISDVVLPQMENGKLHRVGTSAFQGCTGLISFDFGNTRLQDDTNNKAIGKDAFQGCTNLKSVNLGQGAYPSGMQAISVSTDTEAFKDCTSLSYVGLPESLSQQTITINVGDRAFMNTDLGNFPAPGHLGFLPLGQRNVGSIGASAFENSGLAGLTLPRTLTSIGDRAFAGNHIPYLQLPDSPALDGHVGAGIMADQDLGGKGAVYYGLGDPGPGETSVILGTLAQAFGMPAKDVCAPVAMALPGGTVAAGAIGQSGEKAVFSLASVPQGSTLSYGFNVRREGSDAVLSTGSAKNVDLAEGRPMEFHFYEDAGYGDLDAGYTHVQWMAPGARPDPAPAGVPNYGAGERPGYHVDADPYDSGSGSGWRWDGHVDYPLPSGQHVVGRRGDPVDPATVPSDPARDYQTPTFANRWLANSYSVEFDDNWDYMLTQEPALGMQAAGTDGSTGTVRNPDYVWGSLPDSTGLTYGQPKALPRNDPPASAEGPQGAGFKMGGYRFVGWATSPDLPVSERRPGSNFFDPADADPNRSLLSKPGPVDVRDAGGGVEHKQAPGMGDKVVLYAQWQAKDLTADPLAGGSIMIPARIQMQQDGAHLWSESPDAAYLSSRGFPDPSSLPAHAVPVWAAQGSPGASWPAGIRYQVFVKRSAPGASLLSLACADPGADPAIHAVDVLKAPEGAPYDPGPDAADPSAPLMELAPSDQAVASGLFYLRSQDRPWDFAPNASYAGTMTFVLRQVGP